MRTIIICLCLLTGCAGDKTNSETNVLCSTTITQHTKAQETPLDNITDNLTENQDVVGVEEVVTPEGIQEIVTVATNEYAATVEQCNGNGGVSDNDVTIVGNEQ